MNLNPSRALHTRHARGKTQSTKVAELAKVRADIDFLQERIALMQSHRNPNRAVLQTYQTMLSRRETALAMLLSKGNAVAAPIAS